MSHVLGCKGPETSYLGIVSLRKGLSGGLKRATVPGVRNPYSSILGPFSWNYLSSSLEVLEKKSPRKLSFTLTWFSLGAWQPEWNWGLHKGEKGEDKKGDCRGGFGTFGVLDTKKKKKSSPFPWSWLEYRLVSLTSLLPSFLLSLCYSQVEHGEQMGQDKAKDEMHSGWGMGRRLRPLVLAWGPRGRNMTKVIVEKQQPWRFFVEGCGGSRVPSRA